MFVLYTCSWQKINYYYYYFFGTISCCFTKSLTLFSVSCLACCVDWNISSSYAIQDHKNFRQQEIWWWRKTSLRSSWNGRGTFTDPVEVTKFEVDKAEPTSKPEEADSILWIRDIPSQASNHGDTPSASGTSKHGHQSQLCATDEKTRASTETLDLLRSTDDPNKAPLGEKEYFRGSGLWDNISCSQMKKKGHSHQTIQQSTVDTPTSDMMSVPVKTVSPAKVIIDDMVNFSSRLGSPNPLMMAIEGDKLSGPADLKHKRQPHPLMQPQHWWSSLVRLAGEEQSSLWLTAANPLRTNQKLCWWLFMLQERVISLWILIKSFHQSLATVHP